MAHHEVSVDEKESKSRQDVDHSNIVIVCGKNNKCATGLVSNHWSDIFSCRALNLPDNPVSVHAGFDHSGVITQNGTAYLFGDNALGQTGNGSNKNRYNGFTLPHPIVSLSNAKIKVVSLALGGQHTLFLSDKGIVYGLGNNNNGQCGTSINNTNKGNTLTTTDDSKRNNYNNNNTNNFNNNKIRTPQAIAFNSNINIVSISAGYQHSCCLSQNGELFMFGNNQFGQCGVHTRTRDVTTGGGKNSNKIYAPQGINISQFMADDECKISKVCLGRWHSLLLDSKGNMYSTGWKRFGVLGITFNSNNNNNNGNRYNDNNRYSRYNSRNNNNNNNDNSNYIDRFTRIVCQSDEKMIDISCGAVHNGCVSFDRKRMLVWGRGKFGRLGFNDEYDVYQPTTVLDFSQNNTNSNNYNNNNNNNVNVIIDQINLGGDFTTVIVHSNKSNNNNSKTTTTTTKVYKWGKAIEGQLGIGNGTNENRRNQRNRRVKNNKPYNQWIPMEWQCSLDNNNMWNDHTDDMSGIVPYMFANGDCHSLLLARKTIGNSNNVSNQNQSKRKPKYRIKQKTNV